MNIRKLRNIDKERETGHIPNFQSPEIGIKPACKLQI